MEKLFMGEHPEILRVKTETNIYDIELDVKTNRWLVA